MNIKVKYRTYGIPPKPVKLEIPGWAGDHHDHSDGCTPQPWHCIPFVEASTYGLELRYSFKTEVHVINKNSKITFQPMQDGKEIEWSETGKIPFSHFAPGHYGMSSLLDVQPPDEHVIRLEPHPRYFTDHTETCPLLVPGHIRSWWSRVFFVVFKMPSEGTTHIFRHDEPYGQFLIVSEKVKYDLQKMNAEERKKRHERDKKLHHLSFQNAQVKKNSSICKHVWNDHENNQFDDKYKQMLIMHNNGGDAALDEALKNIHPDPPNIKQLGKFIKNETFQNKEEQNKDANSCFRSQ
ncbi:MAG: hypothetical protein DWQ19_11670 [Crenarchaeota archaeon]|nr:MAG: hypothetical protein DWQ19_11670 [Thermoproteota archaeon]